MLKVIYLFLMLMVIYLLIYFLLKHLERKVIHSLSEIVHFLALERHSNLICVFLPTTETVKTICRSDVNHVQNKHISSFQKRTHQCNMWKKIGRTEDIRPVSLNWTFREKRIEPEGTEFILKDVRLLRGDKKTENIMCNP